LRFWSRTLSAPSPNLTDAILKDMLSGGAWFGFQARDLVAKGDAEPTRGRIEGLASVEIVDREGETLIQDGMKLEKGTPIILEHPRGVLTTIGEVVEVTRTTHDGKPATLVKGDLFLTLALGKMVWEQAVGLQKAEATFQLGFSVEGKSDERDATNPTIVRKSTIAALAVTMDPHCAPARWTPQFAKGFIPIAGESRAFAQMLAKSTIGLQQQGTAFASTSAAELAPIVPQSGFRTPPTENRESAFLAMLARLGLDFEDLAVAALAKTAPTTPWADARDLYQKHAGGARG